MNQKISAKKKAEELTDKEDQHIVLILGMHRSGTSAIGRLLKHLGIYFGNNLIKKMGGVNEDGFWEDKTVVAINERIFELLGLSWYSFQSLPAQWWEMPILDECYTATTKWFDEDFLLQMPDAGFSQDADYRIPMAIKDPRFCRLLPFWLHFFNKRQIQPKIVFIYRHPFSVAASLQKRDKFCGEVSCLLWLTYMLDALEKLPEDMLPLLCYEKFIDNPVESTKVLLNNPLKAVPRLKRLRFTRAAVSTIDPTKNHNPVTKSDGAKIEGIYGNLASQLYKELDSVTSDNLAHIVDDYRKKFNALSELPHSSLSTLQEEVNLNVATNQQLSILGAEHSQTLIALSKKDAIYERALSDAEKRISGTKAYVRKCQARIREQDVQLKTLGKKSELVENLQRALTDRENKLSQNISYIKKCEDRIKEQDEIILKLKKATFFWPFLYAVKKLLNRLSKKYASQRQA